MSHSERIAYKWIYSEPDEVYDYKSYNTSYIGNEFYSYYSVLATMDRSNKAIHIDKDIASYSNTSARHYKDLLYAIPQYEFTVFTYSFSTGALEWYIKEIMELLNKHSKAKIHDYITPAKDLIVEAIKYIKIYRCDKRTSNVKQLLHLHSIIDNLVKESKELIKKVKLLEKLKLTILYNKWKSGKNIVGLKLEEYTVVKATKKEIKIGCTLISTKRTTQNIRR